MDEGKRRFIEFAFQNGLQVFDNSANDRTIKSKRISPWFLNVGDFNDGLTLNALSEAYADAIIASGIKADSLYGIPEKGVGLVGAVSAALARKGQNVGWFFTRKIEKKHGEATGKTDLTKNIVGKIPNSGEAVGQLDDVFTTGETKYEARETLHSIGQIRLGDFQLPYLAIALDRQEVDIGGKSAVQKYEELTGTRVISAINAIDVLTFLKEEHDTNTTNRELNARRIERLSNYLRVYGTEAARNYVGKLEQRIIGADRSVIPACDVSFEQFPELVRLTADIPGIGGYKIPARAGRKGWENWVKAAREYTDKPLIHDGQKWGTDIPATGKEIMKDLKESGFDAVIIFPQAGPETERAWIFHAYDRGLKVIVGGRMTHPGYTVSEGGWITDEGGMRMYEIAAESGVNNFVVPGNKLDVIKKVRELVEAQGVKPVFYSPGFIAQGGVISDAANVAGERFHGIVGRGIYAAADMRKAAIEHCSQLK